MGRQGEILLPGERRRFRPFRRGALAALAVVAAMLAYPHLEGRGLPRPGKERADAIMVLAGGENRIRTGLALLREGAGTELHIVGAGRGVTAARVIPGYDALDGRDRDRIHIESWSENTFENAASVKSIVNERRLRSIVLVTSDYHVPRAARAVRAILPPDVAMTVVPVGGERKEGGRERRTTRFRLYLAESVKYWGFRLLLLFE
jgi:uncharacterized SAM-binding protein YcdF (DUF218 family)